MGLHLDRFWKMSDRKKFMKDGVTANNVWGQALGTVLEALIVIMHTIIRMPGSGSSTASNSASHKSTSWGGSR